jgi:hypothetical protein
MAQPTRSTSSVGRWGDRAQSANSANGHANGHNDHPNGHANGHNDHDPPFPQVTGNGHAPTANGHDPSGLRGVGAEGPTPSRRQEIAQKVNSRSGAECERGARWCTMCGVELEPTSARICHDCAVRYDGASGRVTDP